MPTNEILCISYFDQVVGPTVFYCHDELDNFEHPDLGTILEFLTVEGTFIFAFRKFQTVNHLFYIESKSSRGGKELVMISYLIRAAYFRKEIEDVFKYLDLKNPVLEQYAAELRNMEGFPILLHKHKRTKAQNELFDIASDVFKKEFLKNYNKYFKKLSPKIGAGPPVKTYPGLKKLFIIGSKSVGKKTLLKTLEAIQFYKQNNNDLPSKILELSIDNLAILTYDCVENDTGCEECLNYGDCVEKAQGFVLLFNVADKNSIVNIKDKFQRIAKKTMETKNGKLPILIIGNLFNDKTEIDAEYIDNELNLKELREYGIKIKYYTINILKEDPKLMKAFRWLIKHII